MKTINLVSLVDIYNKEHKLSIFYENYLETKIKLVDLEVLSILIKELYLQEPYLLLKDFNDFYVSYNIPQIGKEFDLLRLTETKILNIEYKSEFTNNIENQLRRNNYYLKFLDKKIYLFTFISKDRKLYKLVEDHLVETNLKELAEVLRMQSEEGNFYKGDLNKKFIPSNYLISPFSRTQAFINDEYFLTQRQEEIKQYINQDINEGISYFIIYGDAGTGKTLLVYDIAKEYFKRKKNVGLIHCGKLNSGHKFLSENFNWNIVSIKDWQNLFLDEYPEIIIIDEFQRINQSQFNKIVEEYIRPEHIILIMSGDGQQILRKDEGKVFEFFEHKDYGNVKKYKLKSKIRTNKEITTFLKIMLNLNEKEKLKKYISSQNIDVTYFETIEEANNYIAWKKDYQYISYTPSMYYRNKYADSACLNPRRIGNSHEVIGQEFNNVIVVMGEQFYYDKNLLKDKEMEGIPYATGKMLYQQITRAINKIEFVIVNNIDVFNKLIGIFN